MNSVNLIGRLTADPEMKTSVNDVNMLKFTLAVDRGMSSEKKHEYEQEGKQTADFLKVIAWGKLGENIAKYVAKGDKVAVSGRLTSGKWQRDDGSFVYTTDIKANSVDFLSVNKKKEQ